MTIARNLIVHSASRHRPARGFYRYIALCLTLPVFGVICLIAQTAHASLPLDNIEAGQLLMREISNDTSADTQTTPRSDYQPALHLESEVNFAISAMVAEVTLVQRFRNPGHSWREALYIFPLPETAAVNGMKMRIGERVIRGEIQEKQKARQTYQAAKKSGRKASLVEQQRPNLFTQKVANIAPGETIEVQLRYIQKVRYQQGHFSLRFPMTLTPRYIPGVIKQTPTHKDILLEGKPVLDTNSGWGWAAPTTQVPDADYITPPMRPVTPGSLLNPITITASLEAGLPLAAISSEYHNLSLRRDGDTHQIELVEKQVSMDRDFVLTWEPVAQKAPVAAVFNEAVEGEHYAMVMLLPPQKPVNDAILPREIVFVIDTSGSMSGNSIRQARQSLQMAIARLRPGDQFNIIEFNSRHRTLFPHSQPATPKILQHAKAFVSGLQANGGTEMSPAIAAALTLPANPGFLKQVVFITDGSVGNEQALFAQIERQLGSARLFTVGIGSAPNSFFMRKAAQFGRGTFTYVGAEDEVQKKMSALFSQLESPVLGDITIEWPDSINTVEVWPQQMPDLYLGEPLIITAKLDQPLQDQLTVQGRVADQEQTWQQSLSLNGAKANPGIANLWARDKIAALMDRKALGATEANIKPQVLTVALRHKLVSAYTSFVAVEKKISRPNNTPLKSSPVPNAVAKGQQMMPVAYPRTATPGPIHLAISVLCLLMALLINRQKISRPTA